MPDQRQPREAGELLHGRGLLRHVRGAADRRDLRLEPVHDGTAGRFTRPARPWEREDRVGALVRHPEHDALGHVALTAVGTAPYRSAVATACTPSGRPSPSSRMKIA